MVAHALNRSIEHRVNLQLTANLQRINFQIMVAVDGADRAHYELFHLACAGDDSICDAQPQIIITHFTIE